MNDNRRNWYRILHVQPEAPFEIIKASYRTLMTTLCQHPDRGGDHATAALINQAYAVLSDAEKRRQYDRFLALRKAHGTPQARQTPASRDGHTPTGRCCAFCAAPVAVAIQPGMRCHRCDSPLASPSRTAAAAKDGTWGRRTIGRIPRNDSVIVYLAWPGHGQPARLRDLSPSGLCFVSAIDVREGQVLKITGAALESVARVVAVRSGSGSPCIHVRFLSVLFPVARGGFVSMRA